jgi:hypothetical protein
MLIFALNYEMGKNSRRNTLEGAALYYFICVEKKIFFGENKDA